MILHFVSQIGDQTAISDSHHLSGDFFGWAYVQRLLSLSNLSRIFPLVPFSSPATLHSGGCLSTSPENQPSKDKG